MFDEKNLLHDLIKLSKNCVHCMVCLVKASYFYNLFESDIKLFEKKLKKSSLHKLYSGAN